MKKWFVYLALLPLAMMWGCEKPLVSEEQRKGKLSIDLTLDANVTHVTRSGAPNPADFVVEVWNDTEIVKEWNPIGSANAEISLTQGDYKVKVYSAPFNAPAFERPVYGAEQSIGIVSGQDASADLICTQTNAGVRIVYDTDFQAVYTTYSASVSQGVQSLLFKDQYAASTGYFPAGDVVVTITADGRSSTMDLTLFPRRIYTVVVQQMPLPGGGFGLNLGVDTGVDEENVDFLFPREGEEDENGDNPEPTPSGALYSENFGTYYAGADFSLNEYTGWETTGMSWSGQALVTRPGTLSAGYSFASGGNAAKFTGSNKELYVENTALSSVAVPLTLTFAVSGNGGGSIQPSDLELYVDRGSGIPIGVDYTLTDGGSGWSTATLQNKIQPPSSYLALKFVSKKEGIYLDDIRLTVE